MYSTIFYTPPRSPNPYLLYTIFHEKGTPFVYLLLTNGSPFTFRTLHPFASFPFKCSVSSYNGNQSQKRNVFSPLESHKIHLLALLGPFVDPIENDRFPNPFIYFNEKNPFPFIYLSLMKVPPFRVEPPPIGHYREYLPPPPRILRTHARLSCTSVEKYTLSARNFYVRTCVKFTLANKREAMHERSLGSVTQLLV